MPIPPQSSLNVKAWLSNQVNNMALSNNHINTSNMALTNPFGRLDVAAAHNTPPSTPSCEGCTSTPSPTLTVSPSQHRLAALSTAPAAAMTTVGAHRAATFARMAQLTASASASTNSSSSTIGNVNSNTNANAKDNGNGIGNSANTAINGPGQPQQSVRAPAETGSGLPRSLASNNWRERRHSNHNELAITATTDVLQRPVSHLLTPSSVEKHNHSTYHGSSHLCTPSGLSQPISTSGAKAISTTVTCSHSGLLSPPPGLSSLPPTPPGTATLATATTAPATGAATSTLFDQAYGYFLDRGNGKVTRLIPVDMLPPGMAITEVPATQPYVPLSGMAVLPALRGGAPQGVWDGRSELNFDQVRTRVMR